MASGDRERVMRGDQILVERDAIAPARTPSPGDVVDAIAHVPILAPPPEGVRRPPSSWLPRRR